VRKQGRLKREHLVLKALGEDAAARYLERKGMNVVARNWRMKMGELDLVAVDGSTLVFVEVKARRGEPFIEPELAVGYDKQKRLRRVAEAYLAIERPFFKDCRFDVISVVAGVLEPKLRHIPNAF
jgi:putative endonuclease